MTPQIFCTATLSNILLAALQLRQHLPLTPVSNFLLWKPGTELLYTFWQVCAPWRRTSTKADLNSTSRLSLCKPCLHSVGFLVVIFRRCKKKNYSTVNGPFVFGACLAVAQPRTKQLHRWKISQVRLLGIGAYKRLALLKICIRPVICRADPHTPSMRAVVVYSQAKSNYFHIL